MKLAPISPILLIAVILSAAVMVPSSSWAQARSYTVRPSFDRAKAIENLKANARSKVEQDVRHSHKKSRSSFATDEDDRTASTNGRKTTIYKNGGLTVTRHSRASDFSGTNASASDMND